MGGKVGPFRAGVSTRGIGAGAGPLSVGTGWKKRGGGGSGGSGCGALIALAIALAIAYWALAWPWLATRSIAQSDHVSPHGQHVLAWIVESFYLLALLSILPTIAARHPGPILVGVGLFGVAFIVAACIHGNYDPDVAAAQQARSECTPSLAATVSKARDLVEAAHARYPKKITEAQWNALDPLYSALSNKQDKLDDSDPLYADLDAWLNAPMKHGLNFVEGEPEVSGMTSAMMPLLTACGLTP